ncbi:hypothetical protein ACFOLC_14080 [Lysobacter cavernae]|uniref:Proline-rich protein n=1 Tax=Lysobacter cavernae TaxID=1685901 RepID=A0ABV7RTA4_9GAMM
MRDDEVPSKTEAGRDEILSRARKLPTVLRSILLLVDGQRNVAQLREVIAGLHGPADALEQLRTMDLVAVPGGLAAAAAATIPTAAPAAQAAQTDHAASGGAYGALYTMMTEAVREHLGLRGYFLQLKIERCSDVAGLQGVLPELKAALTKAHDDAFAREFERRLQTATQG